ncbi:hypothetical protein GCM10009528_14370 [Kineococcus aurantiacus]
MTVAVVGAVVGAAEAVVVVGAGSGAPPPQAASPATTAAAVPSARPRAAGRAPVARHRVITGSTLHLAPGGGASVRTPARAQKCCAATSSSREPVTRNSTDLATDTAWSAKRS